MHAIRSDEPEDAWTAARGWARSGVMALCGLCDGPPLLPPLGVPPRLSALAREIELRTERRGRTVRVSWEAALAGRASLLGLKRQGTVSPNGTCRLFASEDGVVALSVSRESDFDLLPALTGRATRGTDPWSDVAAAAAGRSSAEFVGSARLLGLAAAVPGERHTNQGSAGDPYLVTGRGRSKEAEADRPLRVIDLSGLWAGPLAARFLAEAGAQITKVEDPSRPDGARNTPRFYSWVHPASERAARIDFNSNDGRRALSDLLQSADVVIEASRPRALEQIGLSPELNAGPDGQVWLSITGHGRTGDGRNWTGFGDDTAISGGLLCRDANGNPMFCGDAAADPLTGLAGALAVLRSLDEGGGQLIDISMSGTAAWFASGVVEGEPPVVRASKVGWELARGDRVEPIREGPPGLPFVATS